MGLKMSQPGFFSPVPTPISCLEKKLAPFVSSSHLICWVQYLDPSHTLGHRPELKLPPRAEFNMCHLIGCDDIRWRGVLYRLISGAFSFFRGGDKCVPFRVWFMEDIWARAALSKFNSVRADAPKTYWHLLWRSKQYESKTHLLELSLQVIRCNFGY